MASEIDIAVMVNACFGNYKGGIARANPLSTDFERVTHLVRPRSALAGIFCQLVG
ncbi:MAG: hypothetical protein DME42_12790 [Verrucomicrobia bacterium]|nr:MAG: hypothetical protein DME42_12790 [Verrucomicrobiota bacterium]